MNAVQEDRLISIRYVATKLDLSVRAVYRLIAKGDFPRPVKAGGATRFYQSDLDEYMTRLRAGR